LGRRSTGPSPSISSRGEGAADPSAARLVLAVVGAASLAGALSGDLVERLGARSTVVAGSFALSASLALIAIAPGSWLVVVPSALLFGAAYNVLIAVEAIWSARVFAGRPATGLAAVMFVLPPIASRSGPRWSSR
jgi:predicted MFS family arabinose efflux permease